MDLDSYKIPRNRNGIGLISMRGSGKEPMLVDQTGETSGKRVQN